MFKLGDARKQNRARRTRSLSVAIAAVTLAIATIFAMPAVAHANVLTDLWEDVVSLVAGDEGIEVAAAGDEASKVADASTMTTWQEHATKSTQNIGRIWTDKSVSTSDVELGHLDGSTTTTVGIGKSDFLVALSALSSASNTSVTTTTPLDIVLVLDVSGSMSNSMGSYIYRETYDVNEWGRETYYVKQADESYAEVERITTGGGWRFDHWEVDGQRVYPKTSVNDTDASHVQFYTREQQSKMDALKSAVDGFIDDVDAQNANISDENLKHNISLVKFANDSYNQNNQDSVGNNTYGRGNYTQIVSNMSHDAEGLKNSVAALSANGATAADYGFNLANRVLDTSAGHGARANAKKLVVFFTDGDPTHGSRFDPTVANDAIKNAKNLGTDVTVYSIGVFSGADPSVTTDQSNGFMHGVSSNYPNATAYNNLGGRATDKDGKPTAYYKAASDASELDQIFQDIFTTENTGSGSPTHIESGDPAKGGYITFTDQLGAYMQVDDFKSIVFADTNFTNVQKAEKGNTVTYTFTGKVPDAVADIYPQGDLSDVVITVQKSDDLATGDTVTVKIPASLIPLRYFGVDKTAGTMSVKDTYPMRVFFGVSLKDGVAGKVASGELAGVKEGAAYIANHTDKNGNVYFLSNSWGGKATGDTTATFEPALSNNYYYFTQDTPIYADQACTQQVRGDLGNATYYYQQTYYEMSGANGYEEKTAVASFRGNDAENLNGAVIQKSGKAYFKAGTPRLTYINELKTEKGAGNTTATASQALNPQWDNGTVGSVTTLTGYLGNNGKIAIEQPGKLVVSKTVDVPDGFTLADYADVPFDYTVTSDAAKGKTVTAAVTDSNGNTVAGAIAKLTFDAGGKATFLLKHGQIITIDGLSAGSYTVTESAKDGFTAKVGDKEANEATVALKAAATERVSFTNMLTATPTSLGTANQFKGSKTLTGRAWTDADKFAFLLAPSKGAPMPKGNGSNLAYATAKAGTGEDAVSFQFGDIQYDKPGVYTYEIYESEKDSATGSGVTFSQAVYQVTVTVRDANKDGKLSAAVEMKRTYNDDNTQVPDDQQVVTPAVAAFTNSFSATEAKWNPTGNKTYTDNSDQNGDARQFTFRVTASDGAPVPDGTKGREFFVNPTATGSIIFPQMTFDASSIGTHTYTVQEVVKDESGQWVNVSDLAQRGADTYTKGGMTYDASVQTVTVTVSPEKQADGTTVIKVTPTYSNGKGAFAFANSYTPTPAVMDTGTAIKGTKTLNGRDMKDGETFGFTLAGADQATKNAMGRGGSITGLKTSATVQGGTNGKPAEFSFGGATFTKPGTFTFNVRETAWNGEALPDGKTQGMSFDRHTATVTVTISDDNGVLKIARIDYGDGATAAAFANTYEAATTYGDHGALKVSKTLTGRTMAANEFGFTITRDGANGPDVPDGDAQFKNATGALDGAAEVMTKLGSLAFTQDDAGKTYTYVVREVAGTLPGVTYDSTYYKVAITPVDNGDGTMKTETTLTKYDADGTDLGVVADGIAAFANTYKADSVTFDTAANATLHKRMKGRDWTADDRFTFDIAKVSASIKGLGADDALAAMPLPNPASVTLNGDGALAGTKSGESVDFGFGSLTFDQAGTYVYQVTEQNGGTTSNGLTYSSNKATVTITVTDNTKTGKLEATAAVKNDVFENTYTSSVGFDDAATFTLTKQLTGHAMAAGQFKFDVTANATGKGDTAVTAKEAAKKIGITNGTTGTVDGAAGADGAVVSMPADGVQRPELSFGLADSGKTFSYTFTEQQPTGNGVTQVDGKNVKDGYTYDNVSYTMDVTPADQGNGSMSVAVRVTKAVGDKTETLVDGTWTQGDKIAVTLPFVNAYAARGTATITGSKAVEGPWTGDRAGFTFAIEQVADENGTALRDGDGLARAQLPGNGTATSNSDGAFEFKDIAFTKPGTYYFKVTESAGLPGGGWANDTSSKLVKVTVAEEDANNGNGKLTAAVDADDQNAVVFTNTYTPAAVTNAPASVTKVLTGRDVALQADEFTFQMSVAAQEGSPADGFTLPADATAKNDADGNVAFGNITFTKPGTYTVTVKEQVPGDADKAPWMTYDNHAFTYDVVVSADGSAQLQAVVKNVSTADGGSTFTNVYKKPEQQKEAYLGDGSELKTNIDGQMVGVGDTITYKIDWANDALDASGASVAADVSVTDAVPSGTAFVSASDGGVQQADGSVAWKLGSQAAGATGSVSMTVKVLDSAVSVDKIENKATITIGEHEASTNTVTNFIPKKTVTSAPEVEGNIQIGDELTYTIGWANTTGKAANVVVTDVLADGLTFVKANKGGSLGKDGKTVTWSLGEKASGASGEVTVTVRVNEDALKVDADNSNKATIQVGDNATVTTNTVPGPQLETGALKVTKTVVDGDANKAFDFTVAVADKEGHALNGTYGDLAFKDGKATFQLKHGESQEIAGLPEGATYTVTEAAADGYTATKTGDTGAITANETAEASFTNTYSSVVPGDKPVAVNGLFKKVFTGRTWTDADAFEFKVVANTEGAPMPDGLAADGTVTVKGDGASDTQDINLGTINFTFDDIKDVQPNQDGVRTKTFTYDVYELQPADGAQVIPGVTYDTHHATLTVTLTDDGKGNLTGASQIAAVTRAANGTFTNVYGSTLDYARLSGFNITKTLHGRDLEKGFFTFVVTPEDKTSAKKLNLNAEGQEYASVAGKEGAQTVVATVPGNDATFSQEDVGKTYRYTVSEKNEAAAHAGYTYDQNVYTVSITTVDDPATATLTVTTAVTDAMGNEVSRASVSTGAAEARRATVAFENEYDETAPAEVTLSATKTLTGRDAVAGEFQFQVTDAKGNVVSTGVNAASTDGQAGTVSFDKLTYTVDQLVADARGGIANLDNTSDPAQYVYTYDYTVAEVADSLGDGVAPKDSSFKIKVVVTDKGAGELSAQVVYPEGSGNTLAFTNSYGDGAAADVTVKGEKRYEVASGNRPPNIANKFSFELTGSEGAPLPEKTTTANDAAGNVDFGAIHYTMENVFGAFVADGHQTADEGAANGPAAGADVAAASASRTKTFTYTVRETGNVAGVANDAAEKTFTVAVTDNGDGTMTAVPSASGLAFSFTNTYAVQPVASSITDQLSMGKTIDGREMQAGEFAFEMLENGVQVATGKNVAAGTSSKVEFTAIRFAEPGEHDYTVREVDNGRGGVSYDGTAYQAHASVTDNGDGTLSVAWALAKDGKPVTGGVTFENGYTAKPTSLVFNAAKVMTGRALQDGEFSFELREGGKVLQTVRNAADGAVTFDAIEYAEPGEHDYEIAEAKGDAEGVTYDSTVFTYHVRVTDDGEGSLEAAWTEGENGEPVFRNSYEEPDEPEKPEDPGKPEEPGLPETGDGAPSPAVLGALAIAGAGLAGCGAVLMRERRKK